MCPQKSGCQAPVGVTPSRKGSGHLGRNESECPGRGMPLSYTDRHSHSNIDTHILTLSWSHTHTHTYILDTYTHTGHPLTQTHMLSCCGEGTAPGSGVLVPAGWAGMRWGEGGAGS